MADCFRVRLNCVDHYQSHPTHLDPPLWGPRSSATQRDSLPQVPVIRVFGSTETGQKVCCHVHGAFPYLYIPYAGPPEDDAVEAYTTTLRHSIDHALALSYRRNLYDNPSFVAHISLVKGVPFFGYTVGYSRYLKVYMLNPLHMTRLTDLLQQGAIMKRVFQPYEAHQQYLLQWMCDFNLYGCAYVETCNPRFRGPVPSWDELEDPAHLWHDRSIGLDVMLNEERFPRQSHCQIELDIRVEDILNRHEVQPRHLHHSFIERLSSLETLPPEEKLVHSMAGLWKDETRRRKLRMGIKDPSSSPFPPEVLVSMSADPRNDQKGGWIHEDEFREMVEELAKQERVMRGDLDISFDTFTKEHIETDGVQTTLESVEELFQNRLKLKWETSSQDRTNKSSADSAAEDKTRNQSGSDTTAIVDESSITQMAENHGYSSDEETDANTLHEARKRAEAGLGESELLHAGPQEQVGQTVPSPSHRNHPPTALKRFAETEDAPSKRTKLNSDPDLKRVSFRVQDVRPGSRGRYQKEEAYEGREGANAQRALEDELWLLPSGQVQTSPHKSSQSTTSSQLDFPVVKNAQSLSRGSPNPENARNAKGKDSNASSSDKPSKPTVSLTRSTTSGMSEAQRRIATNTLSSYKTAFLRSEHARAMVYSILPPQCAEVESTVSPSVIYRDAFYSNEKDVPERMREYAGQEFRLESDTIPFLPPFNSDGIDPNVKTWRVDKAKEDLMYQRRRKQCTLRSWQIMKPPPTWDEVLAWSKTEDPDDADDLEHLEVDNAADPSRLKRKNRPAPELSQIDGPTQKHSHGFKYSQKKASTSVQHETGYMSTMSLEVHVNTRGDLAPDPERDEVAMIFWCLADEQGEDDKIKRGILVLSKDDPEMPDKVRRVVGNNVEVVEEDDELDLINRTIDIVRFFDPDILTGFEVHNSSWGYLIERSRLQYEYNLPDEFSRMKSQSHGRFGRDADRWGFTHTSTVRITGRHTINIWRAMRAELNLLQYTMENIVFHLLQRRIPHFSSSVLTKWYHSERPRDLVKLLDYFMSRTQTDLEILDANELIPRTSEQARLLGVDFFSVFSRGSQFKVESLMFRIAKPESFVLVSPSRKQVGGQNALECLPLVMEPQSAFYPSPLLVLDFQSLYPSVMIAYNYCYSTCLGRIVSWRGTNKLGFADFKRAPGLLELVKDKLNIAPNGMMYVKPEMRKSLLAKMLGEILETRVMVKSGMKVDKDDRTLQQLLNNRQLALKLIANVTYGYTSASFSGRMPCSEIADSIVQTGRETLEKAIALIHSVERWGAEVVYGDTDSLFVYLKGRTREDAFKIGDEIAKAVTDVNPRPVKLKFEKVYHPCVLLAKKRYVGFKYESPTQTEPEFDAKGIETVRRDGTPAEQKIEEKALKLLFRTADLSKVKSYFQQQCSKIMSGKFSVQDFCFAKEVKLGTYADKGPPPPGALIATKRMLRDPRLEPQYGERVPYVVIAGAPGARLFERCVEPERLIYDEHAELDAEYYISKNLIPPLERIFNLVGANVRQWYDEMPKVQRIRMLGGPPKDVASDAGEGASKAVRKTMESYMGSSLCLACRARLPPLKTRPPAERPLPLCVACRYDRPQETMLSLRQKLKLAERTATDLDAVCRSCASIAIDDKVSCDSRDCPVFYSRVKAHTKLGSTRNGLGSVLGAFEDEAADRELDW
ncbi:hypothetical protein K431DRAFT_282779 [Polychaeton citri CBS 116435]|uniref:DNA polymerase n=1 Tax=Polychaeton citri CBS 116435 TaxID=1314669 RepID=A0A9P4QEZ0_9PEZI|nr:hypothetical protein K431DRAFT_282779 [Polychaeton citri CBS 116435]